MSESRSPLSPADWLAIQIFEPGDPGEDPWVNGPAPREEIEVSDYDPAWPQRYEVLRERIAQALGPRALALEHVGSTAVPQLPAKPVIDIDLIVADPEEEAAYVPALQALGYELTIRERSWYGHRMFRLATPRVNLHVFGPACPEHARHCLFRDWLREHDEERRRYAQAKFAAQQNEDQVTAYNEKKQAVVREIYARLFAAGPPTQQPGPASAGR